LLWSWKLIMWNIYNSSYGSDYIIIFRDMSQYNLVDIYWYFRGMCCLYLQGGRVREVLPWRWRLCTFLWNNGNHILDYMVSHATRQSSFRTRPWTQQKWLLHKTLVIKHSRQLAVVPRK
jgi:hypothetical protein